MISSLKAAGTTDTAAVPSSSPSINAPEIESTRTLRATVRAISSVDQIYSIVEHMFDPASDRNVKNGLLATMLNDAPPFGSNEHRPKGQGYRSNFSTGMLSGIIEPVIGSPVDVIDQAQYLTSASLDLEDDPDGSKTEEYRREFTKLVRSWEGFGDHVYEISQEDVSYGYTAVICDDPDDWPEALRQDDFGVPDNTGQRAKKCQFFGVKKSFYINELIEKILMQPDPDGPWDLDACVDALNEAMPEDRSTQNSAMTQSARKWVDLVRDGNAGAAYDPRARTVDVYILYATEADGKVSKFIVTQRNPSGTTEKRRELYESLDEFESLSDAVMFYALKPASTLRSSKGLARSLANVTLANERNRCKANDATYKGGLVWLHSEKGMVAAQLKIGDDSAIIGSEAKVVADVLPDKSEMWDRNDERMSRYAEQTAGQYILSKPSQQDVSKNRTAREVERDYQQQQQQRATWLKRFFRQFGDEMTMLAKVVGNPETQKQEFKDFQEKLLKFGISLEQIKKLTNQNQGQLVEDLTKARTNAMVQALPLVKASPYWNQYGYERELSIRTIGKEVVDKFMSKEGMDPNDEIEQARQQMSESEAITQGHSRPVSARDGHKVHLKWLTGELDRSEPKIDAKVKSGQILEQPEILDNHHAAIMHGQAHVDHWKRIAEGNQNKDDLKMASQYEGRLKQSQEKQDGWLKAAQEMKKKKDDAAKQKQDAMAELQSQIIPGQMPGQQGPQKGQMTTELLKEWIKHLDIVPQDIAIQLETMSGLTPSSQPMKEKAPKPSNGSSPPNPLGRGTQKDSLTPKTEEVTQPT